MGVEILHHLDTMIEVQNIIDISLINADKNSMTLRWVPHPSVCLAEMFVATPLSEPPSSSITVAPDIEGPL